MKKLKLFFAACALLLGVSNAMAQTNYEVGTRYTDLDALVSGGTLFTIVNEDDVKALCFPVAQDMDYQSYDNAATRNCYTFKLEKTGDNYILRTYTLSGELYKGLSWANGYFNSQPANGTVCFTLNMNQDITNGHVWALESNGAGKFAIKNIGTGKYLKDAAPAKYDDPTYFTLCALVPTKAAVLPSFDALKSAADDIKKVAYKETTSGSHSTFEDAITNQQSAVNAATTAAEVYTAINALKDAIKTYIAGAEPKNEGEYFDITCLMVNPDFSDNTITGWTKESTLNPNTRVQCNEFYGKAAFDFYQVVEGLPNGSYTLSMKAFQRPGGYDEVYADWKNKINKTTAQVYVNSDASTVMNIMEEMNATMIYVDPAGEAAFNSDKKPNGADGYIPNSMEGAAAWFAAGKFQKTVAALVESGSLRLGFKDAAHTSDVWTLFDEFRLLYYGSSKLVYYQQYLPQLKSEVSADLENGAYANVLVSSEDEALDAALAATPASETEEAYKTVIDNLVAAQTAFRAAAPSYDAMVAAKNYSPLTKVSENIGTGVFQYNETTNNSLFSAYETAKAGVDDYTQSTSSTAAGAQALVDALDEAISNYQNQPLNAPDENQAYVLTNTTASGSLKVATESVTVDAGGVVFFTAVEGGYVISNPEGEYIFKTTDNNWTLSTTETKGDAYVVTVKYEGDGAYSIHGAKGYFGTDDTKAGSSVFADKAVSKNGKWTVSLLASSVSKTITEAGWATYCSPYALDFTGSGLTAYIVTGATGNVLDLEPVTSVPANTGVLLEGAAGDYDISVVASSSTDVTENVLIGTTANKVVSAETAFVLMGSPKVGFYKNKNEFTVGANTAYLNANFADGGGAREAYFFDGLTGINQVENGEFKSTLPVKRIVKGYLVIEKNGVSVNAAGVQLK